MAYDMNEEYETTDRDHAEKVLRMLNQWGKDPKWVITDCSSGFVPSFCFTRADGSTDDRATREDINQSIHRGLDRAIDEIWAD